MGCGSSVAIIETSRIELPVDKRTESTADLAGFRRAPIEHNRYIDPEGINLNPHEDYDYESESGDDENLADYGSDVGDHDDLELERLKQNKSAKEYEEPGEKKGKKKKYSSIAGDARKKMAKKFKTDDAMWNAIHILNGNPYVDCRSNLKVVRIFTSSTFTDTKVERNALMETVYPNLKTYCSKLGYEFQVVDMRWGIRSEMEDDHMTVDMCMKEIEACQKVSTGPNFVTFLSHKYGYQPIPRLIPPNEFEMICKEASTEDQNLMKGWYILDTNNVPPLYTLQTISNNIPEFLSTDDDTFKAAKDEWWDIFNKLRKIIIDGVDANIKDPKKVQDYHMAVTEREIMHGILEVEKPEKSCFWFKRNFLDMAEVAEITKPDSEKRKKYRLRLCVDTTA